MAPYIQRFVAGVMIAGVRCYQAVVRPLTVGDCRYVPGCSEYFIEAVRIHGPWHGMVLGVKRVLRCRPGGGWGYDPVPGKEANDRGGDKETGRNDRRGFGVQGSGNCNGIGRNQ